MNRRGLFAALLAPIVARFLPTVKATPDPILDELNVVTLSCLPRLDDKVFEHDWFPPFYQENIDVINSGDHETFRLLSSNIDESMLKLAEQVGRIRHA